MRKTGHLRITRRELRLLNDEKLIFHRSVELREEHHRNTARTGLDFDWRRNRIGIRFLPHVEVDGEKPDALSIDRNFDLLISQLVRLAVADKWRCGRADTICQSNSEAILTVEREVVDYGHSAARSEWCTFDSASLVGRFSNLGDVVVAHHRRRHCGVADRFA